MVDFARQGTIVGFPKGNKFKREFLKMDRPGSKAQAQAQAPKRREASGPELMAIMTSKFAGGG